MLMSYAIVVALYSVT